jgi:superfamily I DNA and/or RNA helicase
VNHIVNRKFQTKKILNQITPYALQVKKLKQKVSVGLTDTDLKIGTVEEFQGQERHIILVSTVRTEELYASNDMKFSLGFLQCEKRMNVAISRARSLMVIFGKQQILEKDERWKMLIDFAIENKTFYNDERI